MPPSFIHVRAFAVHIFTATGAALALAALVYAARREWPAMFLCLGVALIVDGVDGTIARRLKVAEVLPRWSGDVLDLVVDFVTYVFVPAYAIAASGLLPRPLALPAGVVIVVTGALYFADRRDEDCGQLFSRLSRAVERGRLLFVSAEAAALARGGGCRMLAVLTFVPFKFIHPMRVARLRALQHRRRDAVGVARA